MSKCVNSIKYYSNYKDNVNDEIMILELCDCELKDLLKKKKEGFDSSLIRDIMEELNNSFKYMIKINLIHRDIKLENIMIKFIDSSHNQFIPIINDYGLSRELKNAAQAATLSGSPLYMATEIPMNISF